jgi:hypothetical protein
MIPTKTAHRLVAVLAVPALLLVSACGSDDGGGDGSGGGAATVSGAAPFRILFTGRHRPQHGTPGSPHDIAGDTVQFIYLKHN